MPYVVALVGGTHGSLVGSVPKLVNQRGNSE